MTAIRKHALIQVKGVNKLLKQLAAKEKATPTAMSKALYMGGLHLQRKSQQMAPVEQGKLKASAFTRDISSGAKSVVIVGYTASYALYVHESVQMKWKGKKRKGTRPDGLPRKGRYWDPQGEASARFLQRPFKSEIPMILTIVQNVVRKEITKNA